MNTISNHVSRAFNALAAACNALAAACLFTFILLSCSSKPEINVPDNVPVITVPNPEDIISVDESDIDDPDGDGVRSVSAAGQVTTVAGSGDGEITFTGTGAFNLNGLSYNGAPIRNSDITYDNGVYTATVGGTLIFTLTIENDGNYNFVLYEAVDHPDSGDPDDPVTVSFGVRATDADGDTDDGTIAVNILDDGTDRNQVDFGEDGRAVVPETIDGNFGELEIRADGTYTYTLDDNVGVDVQALVPRERDANPLNDDGVELIRSRFIRDGFRVENVNGRNGKDLTWTESAFEGVYGVGNDDNRANDDNKIGRGPANDPDNIVVSFLNPVKEVVIRLADIEADERAAGIDFSAIFYRRDANGEILTDVDGNIIYDAFAAEYNVATGQITIDDGTETGSTFDAQVGSIENGVLDIRLTSDMFVSNGRSIDEVLIASSEQNRYDGQPGRLDALDFLFGGVAVVDRDNQNIREAFRYTVRDGDGDEAQGGINIVGRGHSLSLETVISTLDEAQDAASGFVLNRYQPAAPQAPIAGAPISVFNSNADNDLNGSITFVE